MGRHKKSFAVTTEWGKIKQSGKYSTADIAEKLGVDNSSISNWVSGKFIPNDANMRKLCKLYGIKLADGKQMFQRDHAEYLRQVVDRVSVNVAEMATDDENIPKVDTVDTIPPVSEVPEVQSVDIPNNHVHRVVCRAGESRKVIVRPTNALKQLFGTLVDASVDITSICEVLTAYDQLEGDISAVLDFIYLKVSAESYRKICKAVDPMFK